MTAVIVFDLSEVLIRGLIGVESSLAAAAGLPAEEVRALLCGDHQHRYFCGTISEEDYLDAVLRGAPGLSREALRAAVRENFRGVIPGTRALAERLAATHRVVLLSDHGREWVEHILQIHPWLLEWSERHFSFERGVTKRQLAAFHGLAELLGVPPECCLLIDDSEANVELARQAGWQAIWFRTAEELAEQLHERGLLAAPDPAAWQARPQQVVVAGFVHDGSEVLLARRPATKAIAPGKYHLPGGHVEFGEHPAETLARELREELAVSVQVAELLWAFSYLWAGRHTVGLVYRVELGGARDRLRWDTNDIAECVWAPEERLGDYLARDDHNYQAAVAGFALLRQSGRRR
jgi:2-haloacid dehalogenase